MHPTNHIRVNFMLPRDVYLALRTFFPERKRSQIVAKLIKEEIEKREKELFKTASALEKDKAINRDMQVWNVTLEDGLEDTEWKK